jgi:hypothetical protein
MALCGLLPRGLGPFDLLAHAIYPVQGISQSFQIKFILFALILEHFLKCFLVVKEVSCDGKSHPGRFGGSLQISAKAHSNSDPNWLKKKLSSFILSTLETSGSISISF